MIKQVVTLFILSINLLLAQKLEFATKTEESTQTRKIILLNKNWVYESNDEIKSVSVPFWIDDEKIVIKNQFNLTETKSSIYFLRFEGIRGLEEVYFNDERIAFDPVEFEQYSFRIPSNIVKENGENIIKLILTKKFRIKEQNVLAANLELPERKFGVFKDIYLEILPAFSFTQINLFSELTSNLNGIIFFKYDISSFKQIRDEDAQNFSVNIEVINRSNQAVINSIKEEIYFRGNIITRSGEITISNPGLWNVTNPSIYDVRFQLYQNENLVDQKTSTISFRKIELIDNKLFLNNKPIIIRGITYFESNGVKNSFFQIKDYERDINLIKDLNVNAIFVRNSFPSDELIEQCERNGILVFFDLDSKTYPSKQNNQILSDKKRKLNFLVEKYSNYSCVVGLNLGSLKETIITELKNYFEQNFPKFRILTFVESDEIDPNELKDFDFVAYNFLHKSINEIEQTISKLDKEKFIFISSVGYNHGIDEEEGYSNPYSVQAQAKYLSDLLKILTENNVSFFIHTFSDYRLPYHSIISGKIDNELMKYGLVNEYRNKKKLSYYVLKSYLNESKLPLIMQGDFTESANVIYVVTGLLFLALTIITINSTHRFRENVSRAILKTYNFFSDIRDGWFISSFHSVILAITIALSTSLTYSSLLYYWKDKIDFERFVSLFNSNLLFEFVSYVAWHPVEAIIYLTFILILVAMLLTVTIKFFNLFVKNKIFLNHAFLIVVWSAIPFLILIPLGMVAFKILSLKKYDQLIYLIVILFHLWVITRTLKGISIVFEVKKSRVYFVSICMMILILAILILYLEINFSSIGYFTEYFG